MIFAIEILKNKQSELITEMTDNSKTRVEKLALTMMYDDLTEAITELNKVFFARNT